MRQRRMATVGPKRWLLALIVLGALAYSAARPYLEQQFGVALPSIATTDRPTDQTQPDRAKPLATMASTPESSASLEEIEENTFRSPAGLIYPPGSAEGNYLEHVMAHLADQPEKPIHGVFEGSREEFVALIDEAYRRAKENRRGVTRERDKGLTVVTGDMQRQIGYVGGQSGRRQGHPAAHRLRLVLRGQEVITAYPVK